MNTLLFEMKTYRLGMIIAIGTMIDASVITTAKFPRVTIDYVAMYGSEYLMYVTLNWIMIVAFMSGMVLLGLMIAEKIMKNRGYYEIIQKEKRKGKTYSS